MNVLVYFTAVALLVNTTSAPRVTLPQHERIEILKRELLRDVKGEHDTRSDFLNYDGNENDYDDSQDDHNFSLSPIYSDDEGKKPRKVKRTSNTTVSKATTKKPSKGPSSKREGLRSVLKLHPVNKKEHLLNPLDVFYRRVVGEEFKDTEVKWVHCQDLITPYLTGIKKDPSVLSGVSINDAVVVRFFHLLNTDTKDYSKDEVKSVLYQISKLNLRLFQWDVMPIRVLLNVLIKGTPLLRNIFHFTINQTTVSPDEGTHSFKNLKKGIRERFETWRLSLYNSTKLLLAARIFRPPCSVTSQYSGSTKSQKVSRYKDWITTLKPICDHPNPDDEDCL